MRGEGKTSITVTKRKYNLNVSQIKMNLDRPNRFLMNDLCSKPQQHKKIKFDEKQQHHLLFSVKPLIRWLLLLSSFRFDRQKKTVREADFTSVPQQHLLQVTSSRRKISLACFFPLSACQHSNKVDKEYIPKQVQRCRFFSP